MPCHSELHAGIYAGLVAGILFPTLETVLFFATGGTLEQVLSWMPPLRLLPLQFIEPLFVAGFLVEALLYAGVGAVLGALFGKLSKKITVSPILLAIGLGALLSVLLSIPVILAGKMPNLTAFPLLISDSCVFGILFVRFRVRAR